MVGYGTLQLLSHIIIYFVLSFYLLFGSPCCFINRSRVLVVNLELVFTQNETAASPRVALLKKPPNVADFTRALQFVIAQFVSPSNVRFLAFSHIPIGYGSTLL